MTVIGTKAVPVENIDGSYRKESKIVYEFVQQAFLQAYVEAWKKIADSQERGTRKQFLVIEEINRGNCAQIFGDLFQLLDRNAQGFSDYPITADADMKRQLTKSLQDCHYPILMLSMHFMAGAMFAVKYWRGTFFCCPTTFIFGPR